jgi:chemotaxis protein CheC
MTMQPVLDEGVSLDDALRAVAVNSAYSASRALSKWLHRGVRLNTEGFVQVPLGDLSSIIGDPDAPTAAIHMPIEGTIKGDVLLLLPEATALRLTEMLIGTEVGTTTELGEFEQSALQETGNIVGTSFANCLSQWLNLKVVPGAPRFAYDLACAVVEPLLAEQAAHADTAWLTQTVFELDAHRLEWCMLLLLDTESIRQVRTSCESDHVKQSALHAIVVNSAFSASRAMSKWLKKGVRLSTDGFSRVALKDAAKMLPAEDQVVVLHMELLNQLHGHLMLVMGMQAARELVERLMPGCGEEHDEGLGEMARSCLQETANIVATSFSNCVAKWLGIETEPSSPELCIDMPEAAFDAALSAQAMVSDEILVSKTAFNIEGCWVDCEFFVLPTPSSYRLIEAFCC